MFDRDRLKTSINEAAEEAEIDQLRDMIHRQIGLYATNEKEFARRVYYFVKYGHPGTLSNDDEFYTELYDPPYSVEYDE